MEGSHNEALAANAMALSHADSRLASIKWLLVRTVILALLIPIITYPYVRGHAPVKKPLAMMTYSLRLLYDIVVANLDVARRVVLPNRYLKPGWLAYPLSMTEPFPVTVLASSVSLTPGTVSVEFSEDRTCLYIHVLHLEDEKELQAFIFRRYEQPLKEIFGC